MANNRLLVDERQRELGNFMIGRLLPFRHKRQVGPFTFIDHMGPSEMGPEVYLDVDQHPHIGLSTLTYLFEGAIAHKDSTGAEAIIRTGDVGFMTSGRGVTHTERTPASMRGGNEFTMHGYQIWVALPRELEEMEPRFDFVEAADIPQWEENDCTLRLVAGEAFGKSSPLKGYSPLYMVDVLAHSSTTLDLAGKITGEVAIVIVKGSIVTCDEEIHAGQMLISKTNEQCSLALEAGTRVLLFGGEPLQEERYLNWNFVSHSKERLIQAKQDWMAREFPKVPEDDTYIPYPPPVKI